MNNQPLIELMSSTAIVPAVAVVGHEDGETDRGLGGGDGENEQGEHLAGEIVQEADENATRLRLTDSRMSSTDIRITMMFLRLRMMPATPEREHDGGDGEILAESDHDQGPIMSKVRS